MRKLAALTRQWRREIRRRQELAAMICTMTVNYSMCRPKKPMRAQDLIGRGDEEAAPPKPKELTAWHRNEIAKGWRAFLRGEVERTREE